MSAGVTNIRKLKAAHLLFLSLKSQRYILRTSLLKNTFFYVTDCHFKYKLIIKFQLNVPIKLYKL